MKAWTLRAKLTAWSALLLAGVLIPCAIAFGIYLKEEQFEALDSQLANEAHTFFALLRLHPDMGTTHGKSSPREFLPWTRTERLAEVLNAEGQIIYASKNARGVALQKYTQARQTISAGADSYRLRLFRRQGITLYLGANLREINADANAVLLVLLIAVPLLVAAASAGGWLLSRKALAPIRELTDAAEKVTAAELGRGLPVPAARDEIARLAEVLNQTFGRLERAFTQARRFSADASHEFKTPLTVMRATIEDALAEPALAVETQRVLQELLEQIMRLHSMIESLLLLARADSGRLQMDLADVDLSDLLRACIEDASILAEARHICLHADVPEQLPARLDGGRVTQIVLNLLDNAIKYNDDGGEVQISAQRLGREVFVTVANTGPGVPSGVTARLFERFFRADESRSVGGTGLGLNLARELARAHDGDVTLVRTDAEWTAFSLRLPASDCTPKSAKANPEYSVLSDAN
jgi:signal transduction histidine kinase